MSASYIKSILTIKDLRVWINLGCSPEERANKQLVSLDIAFIFTNAPSCITTDNLSDAVCYLKIADLISKFVEGKSFNLIEYFAKSIYDLIYESLSSDLKIIQIIESLEVTVHKVSSPVPNVHGGLIFSYSGV